MKSLEVVIQFLRQTLQEPADQRSDKHDNAMAHDGDENDLKNMVFRLLNPNDKRESRWCTGLPRLMAGISFETTTPPPLHILTNMHIIDYIAPKSIINITDPQILSNLTRASTLLPA